MTVSVLAVLASAALGAAGNAQTHWPQRPVKLLVPFAAGGNIDVMGRLAAARLSETLGQQFIVENRVGANGTLAAEAVARAAPDGNTLLWAATNVIAIFPAITKVAFDPRKDFAPVSLFSVAPQVLIVTPGLPVRSVGELVAYVRSQNQKLPYGGGGGPGSTSNLLMAMFLKRAGIEMTSVSYRGTAPALTDLIAGHIPTMFVPIAEALPQARAGLVRMLAVSGATRNQQAPEVPTIAESGYPGFNSVSWTGLMAPAGTPKEIIERMATEISRALKDPQFVQHMAQSGVDPAADASPEQFAAFVDREMALWGDAVRAAGVTLQ